MAKEATVTDILNSLDYGKPKAEKDVIEELYVRFNVPPDQDLEQAIQHETPARVLIEVLEILRPFAFMILDIYDFLADAAVRTEGKLEVRVPLDDVTALKLDLNHFRQYECRIIDQVLGSDVDPNLLPPGGKWTVFHDAYWPPRCFVQRNAGAQIQRCPYCPEETRISDFEDLTDYFEKLAKIAEDQLALPSTGRQTGPMGINWESILRQWNDCKSRDRDWGDKCPLENEFTRDFFEGALREFETATRPHTIGDIREFLALPYWKKRWQFFEVWSVVLVLRSYGLSNLELQTSEQEWELGVGSVMHHPIAFSHLLDGSTIEFYYQHEGLPPKGLFESVKARPELLVLHKDEKGELIKWILAAEVKAKKNFGLKKMQEALFKLLEWEPLAIVGANYYSMGSGKGLSSRSIKGTDIVAADECKPRSKTASALAEWLGEFWGRELGRFVDVILIDTSSSMAETELPKVVDYLRKTVSKAPPSARLVATFGSSTYFHPPDALDNGSIDLTAGGGTDLARAVTDCQNQLRQLFPGASKLKVQIITDMKVSGNDVEQLLEWATHKDVDIYIYTWYTIDAERLINSFPDLENYVTYVEDLQY